MKKWEYSTIPLIIHATKQILDQWGDDGWELVQVVPGPDGKRSRGVPEAGEELGVQVDNSEVSAVEARLAGLGITLPEVAAPVASYVPAMVTGNLVFTSGQLPFIEGKLPATGKVGAPGGVAADEAARLAAVCAVNALAAIKDSIGNLDRVTRIVRVVGFVASDPSFTGQPGVINGASDLFSATLGDTGVHARSAVGVAVLPLDSAVEVEVVAEFA